MLKEDLANLRRVCLDTSVRTAPYLFKDITCNFKSTTFTKPSRLAALDRIGHHVEFLTFSIPYSPETFLPPLIDPCTGEEKMFTYKPQLQPPTTIIEKIKQPKYGDWEMTDMLVRQYPPLFHAATNAASFIHAFCSLSNLKSLTIETPGIELLDGHRKSTVDHALISLRTAIEQARPTNLKALSLKDVHASALLNMSPLQGQGVTPNSFRCWSQIRNLDVHLREMSITPKTAENDQIKLVQDYLRNFTRLERLHFRWLGRKGPSPLRPSMQSATPSHAAKTQPQQDRLFQSLPSTGPAPIHPACRSTTDGVHYPDLTHLTLENTFMSADQVQCLLESHSKTLRELNLESVSLVSGTWDEAFSPLNRIRKREYYRPRKEEVGNVPIMFDQPKPLPPAQTKPSLQRHDSAVCFTPESKPKEQEPTMVIPTPERVKPEVVFGRNVGPIQAVDQGRGSNSGNGSCRLNLEAKQPEARKKKGGFWRCEEVRRAFKGGLLHWR